MLGLIKKDLSLVKSNKRAVIVGIIMFILLSIMNRDINWSYFLLIEMFSLHLSTFSYDEFSNFYSYASCMPNGRKNIVKSKYVGIGILIIVFSIIGSLFSVLFGTLELNILIENIIGEIFFGSTVISITYPVYFKYGIEKGRTVSFISCLIILLIGVGISKFQDLSLGNSFITFFDNFAFVILPSISIIFYVVSYIVSLKIFTKKDL